MRGSGEVKVGHHPDPCPVIQCYNGIVTELPVLAGHMATQKKDHTSQLPLQLDVVVDQVLVDGM